MSDVLDFESLATPTPARICTYTMYKGLPAIRVQGPAAGEGAGRVVIVTRKNGTQQRERLTELVWLGVDDHNYPGHPATFQPVAIYRFVRKSR